MLCSLFVFYFHRVYFYLHSYIFMSKKLKLIYISLYTFYIWQNWRSGKTGTLSGALAKLTSTLVNWRSGETGALAKLALWQNWHSGKLALWQN
jgi:hypothetical protein